MEIYLTITFRIVTIMALLLCATLFVMGKRPIGELPVFDFLVLLVIGTVVGADIAQPDASHLPIAFAVVLVAGLQRLVSFLVTKSRRFRKVVTFEPTVVVYNGRLIYANIKRVHYTIDEIIMLLREKEIFDIGKVEYGIVEANGKLSVLQKPEFENPTMGDMKLPYPPSGNAVTVIMEGRIQRSNLQTLALDEQDLLRMLGERGVSLTDTAYASIDNKGKLSLSTYDETALDPFTRNGRNKAK
jgi:uncharacterized membrane protein YcaP (DUF421 family)